MGPMSGGQPGSMAYPNGMIGQMPNPSSGQSMFSNDIFGVPTNMTAMEMMNSELMQQTLMNQKQAVISESQTPTMPFPQVLQQKETLTWIEWFCSLEGHEFLLKVDVEFIKDKINLICLNDKALGMMVDKKRMTDCLRLLLA